MPTGSSPGCREKPGIRLPARRTGGVARRSAYVPPMPFPPVHPLLDAALVTRGYAEPTEVQSAVLRPDADGRDLLVSARTGSGKTVAFGLAAAATLMPDGVMPAPGAPIALAIAPTRELALAGSGGTRMAVSRRPGRGLRRRHGYPAGGAGAARWLPHRRRAVTARRTPPKPCGARARPGSPTSRST